MFNDLCRNYDLRVISKIFYYEFELFLWIVLLIGDTLIAHLECFQNRDRLSYYPKVALDLIPVLAFRSDIIKEFSRELLQSLQVSIEYKCFKFNHRLLAHQRRLVIESIRHRTTDDRRAKIEIKPIYLAVL